MKNIYILLLAILPSIIKAQPLPFLNYSSDGVTNGRGYINNITGFANVSTGLYGNPALLATGKRETGIKIGYRPILNDNFAVAIYNLGGYFSLDSNNTIGIYTNYGNWGQLSYTDINGQPLFKLHAYEIYQNVRYAHKFGRYLSTGIGLKFFKSNLATGLITNNDTIKTINSIAFDIGEYYKKDIKLSGMVTFPVEMGISLSNIGPNVSYFKSGTPKEPLPLLFKFGAATGIKTKFLTASSVGLSILYQIDEYLVAKEYQFTGKNSKPQHHIALETGINVEGLSIIQFRGGKWFYKWNDPYAEWLFTNFAGVSVGAFGFSLNSSIFFFSKELTFNNNFPRWTVDLGWAMNLDNKWRFTD